MMKTRLALLLALAPTLFGQKAEDTGTTIRTETRVVLVDSVVTDKKGGYVRGLTQKDFRVWDDNKEQTVTSFLFQAEAPSANEQTHYMVLFFDSTTMPPENQVEMRRAATEFIDANAGDKRQIAVMDFSGGLRLAQNFTADKDRLKQAVASVRLSGSHPETAATVSRLGGGTPSAGAFTAGGGFDNIQARAMLAALRQAANGMARTPGRKTLVLFSAGFNLPDEAFQDLTATIAACNRSNVAIYPIVLHNLRGIGMGPVLPGTYASLAAIISMPAAFQAAGGTAPSGGGSGAAGGTSGGATSGGGTSSGGSSSGAGARAPAAGSTNNSSSGSFSTGNTNIGATIRPENHFGSARDVLDSLAAGTGGFVIGNTNDLTGGLEKIGKEQDQYYVVGYTPAHEAKPGTCHVVKVKVDKPGTNVRFRSGYCDTKPRDVLSGTEAERNLETKLKSNAAGNVQATMMAPFFYTSKNTARVNVTLDLPPGSLKFIRQKNEQQATLNIVGTALLPSGGIAARFSDSVKVSFQEKRQIDEFDKKPYHYEKEFEIASGEYNLRVAFASGGESFGKVELPLAVDPWAQDEFTLSGLAFSTKAITATGLSLNADEALLEDQTPMIANGVQMIPASTNRFHKSGRGYIYAEIYEPALQGGQSKEAPTLAVSMMLLDPKTEKLKQDLGLSQIAVGSQAGPGVPVGLKLPLDKIEPGTYLLGVMALDNANHRTARLSTIIVEP